MTKRKRVIPKLFYGTPFTRPMGFDILCALKRWKVSCKKHKMIDEPPSRDKPFNGQLDL